MNIWDVTLELKKDGDISRVESDHQAHTVLDKKNMDEIEDSITYTTVMANYYSMGECARIGFEFEKHRTTSRCGNMMQYAVQFMKRFCCGCCSSNRQPL